MEQLGYVVTAAWAYDEVALARHLTSVFAKRNVRTVLDVGASAGQYHDFPRDRGGSSGLIHSFAPQPDLAAEMKD